MELYISEGLGVFTRKLLQENIKKEESTADGKLLLQTGHL
jgi:hypothetical protein